MTCVILQVSSSVLETQNNIEDSFIIPAPFMERGSSVVECWTRNHTSPGSNPSLLPCRRLGIFVLSIDAPDHSAVQLYK